MVYLKLVELEC